MTPKAECCRASHASFARPAPNLLDKMKAISPATSLICSLVFVGGCASPFHASSDAAKYDRMSCVELNVAMGEVAKELSATAITRGKVAKTNIPNWLWGARRVATTVTARQSARIERLQQQEAAIAAVRRRRC
jgi:ketol-acid reductoisomerase